jgi:DNA-binding CsgD family transcriptional regulator
VLGTESRSHVTLTLGGQPRPRLRVDIFRLPVRDWAMHFAPRAIVIVRDPRKNAQRKVNIIAATFALTPAETEVALALCDGLPRTQIAAQRGVSLETLRTQIRSIYSKTGCSRESELVLMLRALLG